MSPCATGCRHSAEWSPCRREIRGIDPSRKSDRRRGHHAVGKTQRAAPDRRAYSQAVEVELPRVEDFSILRLVLLKLQVDQIQPSSCLDESRMARVAMSSRNTHSFLARSSRRAIAQPL